MHEQTYVRQCIYQRSFINVHIRIHTYINALHIMHISHVIHTHMHIHTYMHHAHTRMYTHTYMHNTCVYAHARMYIRTHIHTCVMQQTFIYKQHIRQMSIMFTHMQRLYVNACRKTRICACNARKWSTWRIHTHTHIRIVTTQNKTFFHVFTCHAYRTMHNAHMRVRTNVAWCTTTCLRMNALTHAHNDVIYACARTHAHTHTRTHACNSTRAIRFVRMTHICWNCVYICCIYVKIIFICFRVENMRFACVCFW